MSGRSSVTAGESAAAALLLWLFFFIQCQIMSLGFMSSPPPWDALILSSGWHGVLTSGQLWLCSIRNWDKPLTFLKRATFGANRQANIGEIYIFQEFQHNFMTFSQPQRLLDLLSYISMASRICFKNLWKNLLKNNQLREGESSSSNRLKITLCLINFILLSTLISQSRVTLGILFGGGWWELLTCSSMQVSIELEHFTGRIVCQNPNSTETTSQLSYFSACCALSVSLSVSAQWERQGPVDTVCQRSTLIKIDVWRVQEIVS